MIASPGLNGDTFPVPSSLRPHVTKVEGRNWAIPSAPADETALGFQPDSIWSCAAITAGLIAAHIDPAASTHGTYAAGIADVFTAELLPPEGDPPTEVSNSS